MKFLAPFVLLLGASAQAAPEIPICWPSQIGGSGHSLRVGETVEGRWAGWKCDTPTGVRVFGVVALRDYSIRHPNVGGMRPSEAAAAYWKLNVRAGDVRLRSLRKAFREAYAIN